MIADIEKFLRSNPGAMGKEIARHLRSQKTVLNPILYGHPERFYRDDTNRWYLVNPGTMKISLREDVWVGSALFEEMLLVTGSPLDQNCDTVEFVVPTGCKIMIDAAARLLALCNQLVHQGVEVSIDFSACKTTLSYFNRLGFFDHLAGSVGVLPKRPRSSGAEIHRGKNDGVVELASIDHKQPDKNIPERLKNSLVSCAGESYSQSAFTFISELFGNVQDHSKSEIPGFAALQHYPKGRKIQTVISDSGIGIVGSLLPVLQNLHPEIYDELDFAKPEAGPALVLQLFKQGRISSSGEDGRGLGLKRSADMAATFNATVTVRQKNFELIMVYERGELRSSTPRLGMPSILGTHICFEFLIDS